MTPSGHTVTAQADVLGRLCSRSSCWHPSKQACRPVAPRRRATAFFLYLLRLVLCTMRARFCERSSEEALSVAQGLVSVVLVA